MICHRRRDSEAAGEASPGFHLARLVLPASQSIPQPPLQNPFLLCCRAELAFSGAVSLQEGPSTGGDTHTHTLQGVFKPSLQEQEQLWPHRCPSASQELRHRFSTQRSSHALKAPGQGKQNNLSSSRLVLHPKCCSDSF